MREYVAAYQKEKHDQLHKAKYGKNCIDEDFTVGYQDDDVQDAHYTSVLEDVIDHGLEWIGVTPQ